MQKQWCRGDAVGVAASSHGKHHLLRDKLGELQAQTGPHEGAYTCLTSLTQNPLPYSYPSTRASNEPPHELAFHVMSVVSTLIR
jgi:hypothetical protein